MTLLAGKRALVTGASRGIGRAIAEALAAAGAEVAITSRDIDSLSGSAHRIALDVTDVAQCRDAVTRACDLMGGLDILVNNAGVEQVAPALDLDEKTWDLILDTNLKGAFFMAQAAARAMKSGAILNLCSLTTERGIPTAVPYGSSKTGLLGMTRALAVEWAPLGIRVNAIAPGYFRTALTEPFYADPQWQSAMLAKIPLQRFGEFADLAGAATFLCSDAAAYVTGICLPIDGGTLAAL